MVLLLANLEVRSYRMSLKWEVVCDERNGMRGVWMLKVQFTYVSIRLAR